MSRRDIVRVSVATVAILGGLLAFLGLVMLIAPHTAPPLVDSRRFATLDRLTFLMGSVMITLLAGVLLWLGLAQHASGQPLSRVFLPLLAGKLALVPVFLVAAFASLDALRHGTPRWTWLAEPEVRLVARLALAAYVVVSGWLILTLVLDYTIRPRTLVLATFAFVGASFLIVALAVWV